MSIKSIISLEKRRKLVDIHNNLVHGFSNKSYSQEGEDMILKRIFDRKKEGFFVDVGAYHPKKYSNTYYFYKLGWSGINIDAMPGSMKKFNKVRSRDINLEIPISSKKQILTYYAFNEPALNSFNKELSYSRNGKDGYKIIFEKEIETSTLSEILDKHMPLNIKEIDFMSIDVETLDFDVLQSNNWNKYKPLIILIEDLNFKINDLSTSDIYNFLKQYNYDFFAKTVNTHFFKRNDFIVGEE
ncbi:MAG: FkbM family methyltransferase [Ignavibacteriae bacterium]|nr:FkbM family methyltransferase [Ignavibacteriota bacterium]